MKNSGGSLAFDGLGGVGYSRGDCSLYVNQHTGKYNEGKLINVGRGPTKGNKGSNDGGRMPPVSTRDTVSKPSKMDSIHVGSQQRGVGGASAKCPSNPDSIRMGRGPTKGNQQ